MCDLVRSTSHFRPLIYQLSDRKTKENLNNRDPRLDVFRKVLSQKWLKCSLPSFTVVVGSGQKLLVVPTVFSSDVLTTNPLFSGESPDLILLRHFVPRSSKSRREVGHSGNVP